ncbi:serine protease 23-like [Pungitius pungitius]|uniref:serine protease 23-like n=1 Tax=Pungitius pungitius TaxID=134920 RepID=UPI002E133998
MRFNLSPCVLLCAAALTLSGASGEDEDSRVHRWTRQRLPVLLDTHTEPLGTPGFSRQEEEEERSWPETLCGIECQSSLPPLDRSEQERILGYETMHANGARTRTDVSLQGFNETSAGPPARAPARVRTRRQVYGADGRFVISDSRFITNYPFSTAVRLSTGCSGVLISPKHMLTAAHCIHNGRDYLEGTRSLRVGVMQLRTTGGRRGGRRKGGRKEAGQRAEERIQEEREEPNSLDGDALTGRRGGKGRRRGGGNHEGEDEAGRGSAGGLKGEGAAGKPKSTTRVPRSAEPGKRPAFRWARVRRTRVPQGWIHGSSSTRSVSADYDYALLELKRPLGKKHMVLGVAPSEGPPARVHFSGYDADKSPPDGSGDEKVVYRFCSVSDQSDHLMYQRCDAQPGAAGAGVYLRLRQEVGKGGGKGKWQRRVVGVFSGHRWVEAEGGGRRDFNVAVRITPAKYAQICHWIHGDPELCEEV